MQENNYITTKGILKRLQALLGENIATILFVLSSILFIAGIKRFFWLIGLYFYILLINMTGVFIIYLTLIRFDYFNSDRKIYFDEYQACFHGSEMIRPFFLLSGILVTVDWFFIWDSNLTYFRDVNFISTVVELIVSSLVCLLFKNSVNKFIMLSSLAKMIT